MRQERGDLKEYSGHADYMAKVARAAQKREADVARALREAFRPFIRRQRVEVISFSDMTASDLALAFVEHPLVLKPLLAACNVAARAIERDLGIRNVDTYAPRLSRDHAMTIAGYVKPFLPAYIELPTLRHLDRVAYIDKEVRLQKGRWEQLVSKALNRQSRLSFRKRKFTMGGESFEVDAATPAEGAVALAIDVKRIEARRDIHKRTDEIVNKAGKLKEAYPAARFGVVIYYPFVSEQINVQNRLQSPNIDAVAFAGESSQSVNSAVRLLLAKLGARA